MSAFHPLQTFRWSAFGYCHSYAGIPVSEHRRALLTLASSMAAT
jgi:hypothetical protein